MAMDLEDPGRTESSDPPAAPRRVPAGGGGATPRLLRVGDKFDAAEVREKTRRQLALLLGVLLFLVALSLIAFTAFDLLTSDQAKDLAAAVLSPVVAVTGTALGFYFGGHRSGS